MRSLSCLSLLVLLSAMPTFGQVLPDTTHLLPPQSRVAETAPSPVATVLSTTDSGVTYAVPFASTGNQVALTVANASEVSMQALHVTATDVPAWLTVDPLTISLEVLDASAEVPAVFTFSVDEMAPVDVVFTLRFRITADEVVVGEKLIRLQVEAPTEIVLKGNYPNPFNPVTTIGYALPHAARVSLRVYDVLGREVAQLVGRQQGAGYHEAVFEASRFASGVYVYRLVIEDEAGERTVREDKMLLLK